MRISTTCLNTEILKARIFHRLNVHVDASTYIVLCTYTMIKLVCQNHTSTFHNQRSEQSSGPQAIMWVPSGLQAI